MSSGVLEFNILLGMISIFKDSKRLEIEGVLCKLYDEKYNQVEFVANNILQIKNGDTLSEREILFHQMQYRDALVQLRNFESHLKKG